MGFLKKTGRDGGGHFSNNAETADSAFVKAEKTSRYANKAKGAKGEKLAADYLRRQGYKILKRNYRNPFGEVDIIARCGDVVAFVEVKTRFSDMFGAPSEAVDRRRRERYINAARYYFSDRPVDCVIRFDIIEVEDGKINHIVSAFEA